MAGTALKAAGLILALEGFKDFVSNLDEAGKATTKFNETIAKSPSTTALSAPIEKTTVALSDLGEKWKALSEYFTGQKPPILDPEAWNIIGVAMEDASNKGVTSTTALADAIAQEVQKAKELEAQTKALADEQARQEAQTRASIAAMDAYGSVMIKLGTAMATTLVGLGLVASRIDELGKILNVTAGNAADLALEEAALAGSNMNLQVQEAHLAQAALLTSGAVQEEVKAVRELHLSGMVATEAVAQMIRYELDWTRASELAREAQDAATYAMQDSSVAMNGLIQGIITLQPRLLRTYGIMINLDIAYEKFAQANSIAVKEMSVTQRQQAALNEVLAKAPSIAGAYEASMTTAAKQLRSIKTDSINFAEAMGKSLTPVLDMAVGAFRDFLGAVTDMPEPLRNTIVQTAALGSGLSVAVGIILKVGAALTKLHATIGIMSALSSALFGPIGIVAGLAAVGGALIYINQLEKAHQAEAAATAASTETYSSYIYAIDESGRSVYALSRGLWDLVKAQQAANQEEFAKGLIAAQRGLEDLNNIVGAMPHYFKNFIETGDLAGVTFTDLELLVLSNKDSVLELGTAYGKTREELQAWANTVVANADATLTARQATENYNNFEKERYRLLVASMNATNGLTGAVSGYVAVMDEAGFITGEFTDTLDVLMERMQRRIKLDEEIAKNVEASVWAEIEAAHQRTLALEDLDYDYAQKKQDLWDEMNKELAEIDAQLADIHANILDELLELDEEYARKRGNAYEDMIQAIADADRDLAREQEDAWEDMNQDLIDADEDLAYAIEDKRRDLFFDLEDAAREHADNLADINREAQEDIFDIEEEYAQKRADLESENAQDQADIRAKYKEARIRELVRMGYDEQTIRDNWNDDMMQGPLEEAMDEELAALQENYDEELSDLEIALERERQEREEALQEQIREEEERYAEWREERQRNYARDLEDLERKHIREEEEIRISYGRKLEDLQEQHRLEEEEIARSYQRKLEDLAIQYELQRQEIIDKLEEQRKEIVKKYAEQTADLEDWYADRKIEITREYEKQRAEIAYQLDLTNLKASEKFGLLPGMFQATYDALIAQATTNMGAWSQAIIDSVQTVFDALGAHSPSSVLQDLGESITGGLTLGLQKGALGGYSAGANVLPAMAGMTTNRNNNVSLSMPTTVNSGMDAAIFQQMVLQTVSKAFRYG